jgi:hypothetical protein
LSLMMGLGFEGAGLRVAAHVAVKGDQVLGLLRFAVTRGERRVADKGRAQHARRVALQPAAPRVKGDSLMSGPRQKKEDEPERRRGTSNRIILYGDLGGLLGLKVYTFEAKILREGPAAQRLTRRVRRYPRLGSRPRRRCGQVPGLARLRHPSTDRLGGARFSRQRGDRAGEFEWSPSGFQARATKGERVLPAIWRQAFGF